MKKLSILITLLFLIINSFTLAQGNCRIVYIEEFNTDYPEWSDKSATYSIEKGNFYFEGKKKRRAVLHLWVMEIDESKDFEIEASITKLSTTKKNGYGITFGFKNARNFFAFLINDTGEFLFFENKNGKRNKIIPWTASKHINTEIGSENKLRIIKEDDMLNFYSNGSLLAKKPSQAFFDNKVGFYIQRKQKISIDYLKAIYFRE